MLYGNINLDQHWLIAWQHQAITLTSVDLLGKLCAIHLRAVSQWVPNHEFENDTFKIAATSPRDQWVNKVDVLLKTIWHQVISCLNTN